MGKKRRVSVKELVEGQGVDEVYLVKDASMRETRNGKNYIAAQLADSSGAIMTRMWDAQPAHAATFRTGQFLRVRGHVESYQGEPQLVVSAFQPVDAATVDVAAFMPSTPRDVDELRKQLDELIESVEDRPLRALLDAFFGDEDFMGRFVLSPAATDYHHAYVGGLLEHSVAIARSASALAAERGEELDRDLLVAGALLHDLGKVYEMTAGPAFDYTDAGRLVGHIVMGCMEADRRLAKIHDFPEETRLQVLHLVASHHGQREFGAPVLPATPEALALHHLDNLDAKVRAAADAEPKPGEEAWSDYQRMLGARVYKRRRATGADG